MARLGLPAVKAPVNLLSSRSSIVSLQGSPRTPAESQTNGFSDDLTRRVAVVTGANKGIGFAITKGLCQKFDGIVYLTARNEKRGQDAVKALEKQNLFPRFHQLDVTDILSISTFKDHLRNQHGRLDVLVNNAAITFKITDPTPLGIQAEEVMTTNYYGLLNVCKALFPLLRPHARIVNVSSSASMLSYIPSLDYRDRFLSPDLTEDDLSDLLEEFVECCKEGVNEQRGWGTWPYSISKVGVTALTMIQQKAFNRDSRPDIVVNAVHPGYVDTDMSEHKGLLSPELGAEAPLYLALLPPDVKSPKGELVWCDKSIASWDPMRRY